VRLDDYIPHGTATEIQSNEMTSSLWQQTIEKAASGCVRLIAAPPSLRADSGRLLVSEGTIAAEAAPPNAAADHPPYLPGARIPNPIWREPSPCESDAIWTEAPLEPGRAVAICRVLDGAALDVMRRATDLLHGLRGDQPHVWDHPVHKFLLEAASRVCRVEGPLFSHGIAEHPPGLTTLTFDRDRGGLIGLHLDNWEHLRIEQLPTARNRICINIGSADRWLFFFNLTVADMAALLGRSPCAPDANAQEIAEAFPLAHSDYPVLRLLIRPGEAYLAPTENLVHDGSSVGAVGQSCHITFRGHFAVADVARVAVG
jgi:hypothetical protein